MTALLPLAPGEVHSWCVPLDAPADTVAALAATLAEDERGRSARYRFAADRQRFIVAHGALRDLLGRYLGSDPGEIRFTHNAFGKPALHSELGSPLTFNLSHSGAYAVVAIAPGADVGVDVEQIRVLPDQEEIARRFFAAAAVDELRRLPRRVQAAAFFRWWTRHEAYVKACGEGLELRANAPQEFAAARRWSLYTIRPAPGYIGALAVAGGDWRVRQWQWQASTAAAAIS